jgi:hypothetical protein
MIPPAVLTAFADILPEGGAGVRVARSEDIARIQRMLAADPVDWSNLDINIVMSRAQTTIGGPETFKWVLTAWLDRSAADPGYGWMTVSDVLAHKLDRAGFDGWPEAQRASILPMLADWLKARETAFPDDAPYEPRDDAVLRAWLKARAA